MSESWSLRGRFMVASWSRRQKTQDERPQAVKEPNEPSERRRRRRRRRCGLATATCCPPSRWSLVRGYKSTHLQIAELDASVDEPAPKGCCP